MIRVSHIGIEETFVKELCSSKKFKQMDKTFKQSMQPMLKRMEIRYKRKGEKLGYDKLDSEETRPFIMSSIDTYHPISGLISKLVSYRNFLREHPHYVGRIVLIQFVGSIVQAFDDEEDHNQNVNTIKTMRLQILAERDRIHQEFGPDCLIFEESNPPLEKRLTLWSNSDIILCSSLKDGLCIQVLEYVVCRKLCNKFNQSIMVCSEFAGCNEAMRGVIKYNPFSNTGFGEALD